MNNDDRIERAIEGLLSEEEWRALQADVVRDAELRSAYVERVWLHSALRAQSDLLMQPVAESMPQARRRWPVLAWSTSLAAALALMGTLLWFGQKQPVATLAQADNCKWAGSDLPTSVNSMLGAGKLALVEGIATLRFNNGATVTMEAPTTLEILDAMHCRLLEGSVVAEVPEPAHGFTIDTADMQVVDLGTRFGLTAGSVGNSQVHVFEGEVEVGGLPSGKPQRLKQGKGLNVTSGSTAADQEPARSQPLQEEGGWLAIPTSFGRGQDAYVRRGYSDGPHGADPLIMVKHTDLEKGRKNERRAFITFDLSQMKAREVHEAQLLLDPEPSGFGFSTLVPDSRFAVYGITDEALDDWSEQSVRWDSSPACADEGVLQNHVRKLAEFWIPRGGSGSSLTVRSDALAEFVRQDSNQLVTFIIVRETGESDPSGLVHAFASKEHPTARPPMLRVK